MIGMKHYKNTLSAVLCFFCISFFVNAQDIHFSQFDENAALVNPALIAFENSFKASVIYKDQWRSVSVPYKTFGAQVELGFKPNNWKKTGDHLTRIFKKTDRWLSAGLSFYNDKAGDGSMSLSEINLSLASHIPITRKSFLSAGIEASVVQRTIDYSKLIWPDQYNGNTGYDQSINSGENFAAGNYIYPDFAAGILYNYGYGDKAIGANNNFKMDFGFSVYHFNRPQQSFLVNTPGKRLAPKCVFHTKFIIGIPNTPISVVPSGIVQFQGPASELIAGTYVRYALKENSKYTGNVQTSFIGLGAFIRGKDALITAAQFEFKQYAIGFSYDVNTSQLKTASTFRGGFEIFIHFINHSAYLYQNDRK